MYSPNASSIRAKVGNIYIAKISNKPYEDTRGYLNGDPEPEDWLYTEMIDVSDRMPMEEDYEGYVVEGPINSLFKFNIKDKFILHEATKQVGAINHGMMSPEEVILLSGDRIIRHDDVYEAPRQSKTAMPEIPPPIHGGVADGRLGDLLR